MKVIIIGSGIAGLTAAAYLLRAGYEVKLFEQHSEIGGVTATIRQDGYAWDLGPLLLEGFAPYEPAGRILDELGLYNKIVLINDDRGQSFEDFDLWKPGKYEGPYWRREALKKQFPKEAKNLDKYYKYYDRILSILAQFDRAEWTEGWKRRWLLLKTYFKALPMLLKMGWSAEKFMEFCFQDPKLKVVFTGILADFVVKPSEFIGLGIPRTNVETAFDKRIPIDIKGGNLPSYHYIKGGCGSMVDAFVELIKLQGGEIFTDTLVEKIKIEEGKATGVLLEGGKKEEKADLVLASGGARKIYLDLIGREHLPPKLVDKVENLVHMESVLMVHIGIDFDPTPYQRKPLCYYYRTSDIEGNVDLMRQGHYHEGKEGFLIYITSMHSPEMAPSGCHAVTIYTICPDRLAEGTWETKTEEYAEKLLIEAEKVIPGLREHTQTKVILTPKEFRSRLNVDRHSFGGLAPVMGQKAPIARTPIKNLWHIGCQNQWGGGVTGTMMGVRRAIKQILGRRAKSILKYP